MTARIDNPPACMGCRHSTPTHPVCPCNCHTAGYLYQASGTLPDPTARRKASQPARAVGTTTVPTLPEPLHRGRVGTGPYNGWYGAAAVMSLATGWAAANGANTPAETLLCALAAVGLIYLGATK